MENVQLPALWKLVRREPDGCAWAERIRWNGERGEGWWWVVGVGVWMEMGVVRNVVGRRKGEKEKISGRWGCCESLGGETRRWEEIYKVLLCRVA